MKNHRFEPQNKFSSKFKLSPIVSDSVLTLCRVSDEVGKPICIELRNKAPQTGSYAVAVAVANDPVKIAQLLALIKTWKE